MITWTRPSGSEIVTNDDPVTVQKALDLGWKKKRKKRKVVKKDDGESGGCDNGRTEGDQGPSG